MALLDDLLSPGNAPLFGLAAGLAVIVLIIAVFARTRSRAFLDPERFKLAALVDKKDVSHNTRRFRFALDHEKQRLGLPLGQHISFRYEEADGAEVMRSYTPVSGDDVRGYVDFVIKVYPEGKMSQYLDKLQIGDRLQMRGPKGRLQYRANMKASIGMLAGGTGIAPMFQLMLGILNNPQDRTSLSLVFGNLTEADILLRPQLDQLCEENPDRLKVHYVLDTAPAGWDGSVGYITKDVIQQHMPPPSPDVLVVHCGPPMMNVAMKGALSDLGYSSDMRFKF